MEDREARTGSIAETYREYVDASGNVVRSERVTRDKYRSIEGILLVAPDLYYSGVAADATPGFLDDDELEEYLKSTEG